MLPDLFNIPFLNLPIHTYGVMIVTGFLLALYVANRQAKRLGMYANDILDFGFWALLGGVGGSRVVYIIVDWRKFFVTDPWTEVAGLGIKIPSVLAIWEGGLVIWGGILGGLFAFLIFAKKRKLRAFVFADLAMLGLPLAQALGRVGCIAAGCCWGKAYYHVDAAGKVISDLPLAMRFPPGSLAYGSLFRASSGEQYDLMQTLGTTLPLFPTQLAESAATMLIFFTLLHFYSRKWFHGQIMLTYLILYSTMRSIIEMYRGDTIRGFVFGGALSTSQFISLIVVIVSLVALVVLKGRNARASMA